jgi:hypothetical protein
VCDPLAGWTGKFCDQCSWNDPLCNGGVLLATCDGCDCTGQQFQGKFCKECTLKDSQCLNGGYVDQLACGCVCVDGWDVASLCSVCAWDDSKCSNGGTLRGDCATCDCVAPWGGDSCDVCTLQGNRTYCNDKGVVDVADCDTCVCDDTRSWGGKNCEICQLTDADCTNGQLDPNTCTCVCSGGFSGSYCDACNLTPDMCASQKTYETGGIKHLDYGTCTCECKTLFQGVLCDSCDPNTYCNQENQGFLLSTADTCSCVCPGDWASTDCSVCALNAEKCNELKRPSQGKFDAATCSCECVGYYDPTEQCAACNTALIQKECPGNETHIPHQCTCLELHPEPTLTTSSTPVPTNIQTKPPPVDPVGSQVGDLILTIDKTVGDNTLLFAVAECLGIDKKDVLVDPKLSVDEGNGLKKHLIQIDETPYGTVDYSNLEQCLKDKTGAQTVVADARPAVSTGNPTGTTGVRDCENDGGCNNQGTCDVSTGSCTCTSPYSGPTCADLDPTLYVCSTDADCEPGKCINAGSTQAQCQCDSGFSGVNCENKDSDVIASGATTLLVSFVSICSVFLSM